MHALYAGIALFKLIRDRNWHVQASNEKLFGILVA
jgi:hypothetical protein